MARSQILQLLCNFNAKLSTYTAKYTQDFYYPRLLRNLGNNNALLFIVATKITTYTFIDTEVNLCLLTNNQICDEETICFTMVFVLKTFL